MNNNLKIRNKFIFSINPKKYIYLYKEKISKAFLYVLVLATIIGVIQGGMTSLVISELEKRSKIILNQDELQFEMNGGILDFKESPLKEEEGSALLYIDTNKNIDEVDSLRSITVHKDIVTVLLKDGLMIKVGSEDFTYKYSDLGLDQLNFNNNLLISLLEKVSSIKYIIIPFMIILDFIELIIYAILISLLGLLSNLIVNRKISYRIVFNLSLYAVTLPSIINLIYPIGAYSVLVGAIILMFGLSFISFYNEEKNINNN